MTIIGSAFSKLHFCAFVILSWATCVQKFLVVTLNTTGLLSDYNIEKMQGTIEMDELAYSCKR